MDFLKKKAKNEIYYTTTNHTNLHEYENDEKKQKTPYNFKHELP